jgi:hypothetical protein
MDDAHKYLGYLLLVLPMLQLVLVLAGARKREGPARLVKKISSDGYNIVGVIVILLGLGLWHGRGYPISAVFLWLSLLLWLPVAIAAKRMVLPECEVALGGGEGSAKLLVGTLVQLLCIVTIFVLMTVRPGFGS